MKILEREGSTIHTLKPLRDIDTIDDLRIEELRKKGI
jgi:hypothetical protein